MQHQYIIPARNKNKGSRNTYDQWSKIITVEIGKKSYRNEFTVTKEYVCILQLLAKRPTKGKR